MRGARTPVAKGLPAERQQLLDKAEAHFLSLVDLDAADPFRPDRSAFNELSKRAKALLDALEPFSDPQDDKDNRDHLFAFLQDQVAMRPKEYFAELLGALPALLDGMVAAKVLGSHGRPRKGEYLGQRLSMWVWIAADYWLKAIGDVPKTGGGAAFQTTLLAHWPTSKASRNLPALTEASIETALQDWHARRVALGVQPAED